MVDALKCLFQTVKILCYTCTTSSIYFLEVIHFVLFTITYVSLYLMVNYQPINALTLNDKIIYQAVSVYKYNLCVLMKLPAIVIIFCNANFIRSHKVAN